MSLLRLTGALLTASLFAMPAVAAPPADLDAFVARAMQTFGPPGMTVAIVEDGKPVLAKGYGIRKLGDPAPVDAHTIFPIGSETKAFTAAALAILVDRGKLKWDDRVVDKLPGFAMYDPYATEHMTVRDLLTHRSGLGLGEGDLMIVPATTRSRADIVHALRYLKPVTGFRETFAYDNILYIVAGALVEAVSGETWQHFVQAHILTPAGMTDSATSYDPNAANGVALHGRTDGAIRGLGRLRILPRGLDDKTAGPAGGVNASATDMATWMQLQLAGGLAPDGTRIFSATQGKEMWTPLVMIPGDPVAPASPAQAALSPAFQSYGLGWFIEDYRGHTVVEHTGAVLGAVAALYLIPEKKVGIAVMINSEDGAARRAVAFHLLDHYLGLPDQHWNATLKAMIDAMNAKAQKALAAPAAPSAPSGAPSLPLAAYAGVYRDPWYGTATVSSRGGKLWLSFDMTPDMQGPMVPAGGNTFQVTWTDRTIEAAAIEFVVDKGRIASVKMRPVSPLADFSFDYKDLAFVPAQ
ncbi:MAG TPA: serine hydrolase [Rhizomicrobium sp.]|jgi:CubicO group peptidase (beta-lactamase class C family)|nr:serine hydrolase [Rhizomicrobium sp.]